MKLMKRVVTIIMTLALLAMPMASLAEGQRYSFSVGNFSASVPGTDMNLGLSVNFDYGELDGRRIATVSAEGGDQQIGKITAVIDDTGIKATLDGMSTAYAITSEEIASVIDSATKQAKSQIPFDTKPLMDMATSYVKLLQAGKDPEAALEMQKKAMEEFLAYMGDRVEVKGEESFKVFEQDFNGQRIVMNLSMDDFDKYIEAFTKQNENLKMFFDSYFKFFSSLLNAAGMEGSFNSLGGLYKAIGAEFTAAVDMVASDDGKASKSDMSITVKDGETEFTLPMQMDMLSNEFGQRVAVTIDNTIEGIPMHVRAESHLDGASGDFIFDMKAGPADEEITISADMSFSKGDDKETGTLIMDMSVVGQKFMEMRVVYDADVTKDGESETRDGKLTISGEMAGYGDMSFSADVKSAKAPMTGDEFAEIDTMPVANFSELDEAGQQKFMEEASTIGFGALGALMQTPGVAEIFSMLMSAANSNMPANANPGSADDADGFEDFEDFGEWDDFDEFGDWDDEVAA